MPFGDFGSFDPGMFSDLGGGDIYSGDPSWPGDNFAFGDTSDTSDPMMGNDPWNTSTSGIGGYGGPGMSEIPGGLGGLGGGGGGSGGFNFNAIPGLIQMLGGLTGYSTSQEGIGMTKDLIQRSDPWGYSGGRALAGDKLMGLINDPQGSVASMPNFQAGMEAVQRSSAAGGYLNSGNMMADMLKYGGNMWQQMFQDYAGVSGATTEPGHNAPQLMNTLGQAEAAKNASIISGVSGIANAFRPQAPAQGGGGGSKGGGGGDDFMSVVGDVLPLLAFL